MNETIINKNRIIKKLVDYLFEQAFMMDTYNKSSKEDYEVFFDTIYDYMYYNTEEEKFINTLKNYIVECLALTENISVDVLIDNLDILYNKNLISKEKTLTIKNTIQNRFIIKPYFD